ncbi:GNAT family N-acetyltransferase [Bacteroidales bacterium OttesenSCG-928-J19]|nr:GNAT family N-acetyltransferase [Bacteroidales bacterium OttesenSCG-928-J19]
MLQILPITQAEKWDELVTSLPEYDFYSLAEYHRLDPSGTPFLLSYKDDITEDQILFPVIIRPIPETDYRDVTSVYGYAGPLSQKVPQKDVLLRFHEDLKSFFDTENIVSAFSRLHPLFSGQSELLFGLGEIRDTNPTVVIDLKQPYEKQWQDYAPTMRYDINRMLKSGLSMRCVERKEDVDEFIRIYYENMDRVNASPSYYFPASYFHDFFGKINSRFLLAEVDGQVVGGVLLTLCGRIMQCHLAATRTTALRWSPAKCLWDEASRLGRREGMDYFHLGGGYGGQNDSLFSFKSHFSKSYLMFRTWRYIHQSQVYSELCQARQIDPASSYFPAYRLDKK